MLSPMATMLFTWAAVYAYVGVYFCTLHARRATRTEYLAFGLLSFGLMLWSFGSGLAADAETMDEAMLGWSVELLGGFAAAALFVEFAARLVGRPAKWIVRSAYAVALVGFVADVCGLLLEPSQRIATWGVALVPEAVEPRLTWIGVGMLLVVLCYCGWAVWTIARGVARAPDLRALVWATAIAVAGGVAELATRALGGRTLYVLDHAALIPVLTVSFILQRRFVAAATELGERTTELRQSYSELRTVQEELVRKEQLAAVGELSAVIAHEVRNPLAIIKNALSGLRRATLREADRVVLLEILEEEVDRLNRLARNLLDYARPVAPQGRAVDLVVLAREATEAARATTDDPARHRVEVISEPDIAQVNGDPDLLRQALTNVAANAMQAMPDGGTITIRASSIDGPPPQVRLELEDQGGGMPEEVRAKARDPFFTTRPAGTGLGLAIVDRVVRSHGGSLAITSEADVGTTVVLTLPRHRASALPEVPT